MASRINMNVSDETREAANDISVYVAKFGWNALTLEYVAGKIETVLQNERLKGKQELRKVVERHNEHLNELGEAMG